MSAPTADLTPPNSPATLAGGSVTRLVREHGGTNQTFLWKGRVLVWFSCGAASAVAAKLAAGKYRNSEYKLEVLYCDTLKYESEDNPRFMRDVEQWIQWPIKTLHSEEYADIFDVFDKTGWLVGPSGARCTTELKKNVRKAYQWPEDIHIFGLTADETMPLCVKQEDDRIAEMVNDNPEIFLEWNLRDAGITKRQTLEAVHLAGIKLPALYRQGYRNNNCIGCVKGGMGYWNKIRVDYPEAFARMAAQERKMDVAICKRYEGKNRIRVFLDELPPDAGRYEEEPDIECGPQCRPPKLDEALVLSNKQADR
jgi:hypothetical protein